MAYITKSPWIIHYDGSSCNGCDIEVLACLTPMYDVERFGIINTGNPKHADVFLVTGSINEQNKNVVRQIYEQMPEPKVVVAIGICANNGGIFKEAYNILGGTDTCIPVDCYVPGCAARPEAIIDGVVSRIGLAALFGFALRWDCFGFWMGDALAGFMPLLIGGAFYLSGRWKRP